MVKKMNRLTRLLTPQAERNMKNYFVIQFFVTFGSLAITVYADGDGDTVKLTRATTEATITGDGSEKGDHFGSQKVADGSQKGGHLKA